MTTKGPCKPLPAGAERAQHQAVACTDNTAPGILPLVVRRAEQAAAEIREDGRRAGAETGLALEAIVILVKIHLGERAVKLDDRELVMLELLVECDQVATAEGWGDGSGAIGLCDCRDRDVRPYQSAQLAQVLETARAILEPADAPSGREEAAS